MAGFECPRGTQGPCVNCEFAYAQPQTAVIVAPKYVAFKSGFEIWEMLVIEHKVKVPRVVTPAIIEDTTRCTTKSEGSPSPLPHLAHCFQQSGDSTSPLADKVSKSVPKGLF